MYKLKPIKSKAPLFQEHNHKLYADLSDSQRQSSQPYSLIDSRPSLYHTLQSHHSSDTSCHNVVQSNHQRILNNTFIVHFKFTFKKNRKYFYSGTTCDHVLKADLHSELCACSTTT